MWVTLFAVQVLARDAVAKDVQACTETGVISGSTSNVIRYGIF